MLHTCLAERQAAGNMHLPFDVDGFRGQMLVGVYRRAGKYPPKGARRQKDERWPPEVCCTAYTSGKLAEAAQQLGRGAADTAGPSRAGRKRRYGGI